MANTPPQDTESALFSMFHRVLIQSGAVLMTAACLFLFFRRGAGALHTPPPWSLLVAAVAMTAASIGLCIALWRLRPKAGEENDGKSPFTIETLIAVNTILFGLSLTFTATPTFINALFWAILVASIGFVFYNRLNPLIIHLQERKALGDAERANASGVVPSLSSEPQGRNVQEGVLLSEGVGTPASENANELQYKTATDDEFEEDPEFEEGEEIVDSALEAALLGRLEAVYTANNVADADEPTPSQSEAPTVDLLKDREFLLQETTRTVIEEGGASKEVVTGAVRVRLEPEQKVAYAHVAFCPPFESIPDVEAWPDVETSVDPTSVDSPEILEASSVLTEAVSVDVDECLCGGTRFLVRRKTRGGGLDQAALHVRFQYTASANVSGNGFSNTDDS
jgi:hypothetical protein